MKSLKRLASITVAALMIPMLTACQVQTVSYVDLNRYLGLWYEISSNPTFFNEGLVGTTAEYSLNSDGTIKVVNTGFM